MATNSDNRQLCRTLGQRAVLTANQSTIDAHRPRHNLQRMIPYLLIAVLVLNTTTLIILSLHALGYEPFSKH